MLDVEDTIGPGVDAVAGVPPWLPGSPAKRMLRARAELDSFIRETLQRRRKRPRGDDLLQALVDAKDHDGSGLSDAQICDQLLTLFFAGHETTANALAWTVYLLGRHPDAQRRLAEEVAALGPPTPRNAASLPWTRQCFEEAMRLYPPAFCVFRRAVVDTTVAGYAVPAGSQVDVWAYYTHRSSCFTTPEQFRPERFAERANWPRCAYIPFGAGMRTCIGKGFSTLAGTLVLATLAQRFRFTPIDRVEPRIAVTLTPGPLPMDLQPR